MIATRKNENKRNPPQITRRTPSRRKKDQEKSGAYPVAESQAHETSEPCHAGFATGPESATPDFIKYLIKQSQKRNTCKVTRQALR